MRKTILSALAVIALTCASTDYTIAQDNNFKAKSERVADSIRSKGTRVGKKIANGTAVVVDSIGSKAPRVGKKVVAVGDSIAVRGKKAIKAL